MAEKTDAEALLDAANSASERVAGLHVAFMAVCAYVLVIVFGTTDLDLLMGKGVKLPVVNVDVPIVGFYAFAPYIVVLVHFNLLLQLQLLSRKLFAFDATAPQEGGIGGMHDRLHIFPYTYYLVGRPRPLVLTLVGLLVSITLVLLPLATLLALQLQFLAYQSEAVTWWQRVATWLDVAVIVILWPIILDPQDDWRRYWHELIIAHVPRRKIWVVFVLLLSGLLLLFFSTEGVSIYVASRLLLLTPLAVISLYGWKNIHRNRLLYLVLLWTASLILTIAGVRLSSPKFYLFGPLMLIPLSILWQPKAPRGSLALLLALFFGLLTPPALLVDNEGLEHVVLWVQRSSNSTTQFANVFLRDKRRLFLGEQVLLTKPPKPETLALIRSGNWQEGLKQIEPINLKDRSLRHAEMYKTILTGADLRGAQLQEANLREARLQSTDLRKANLHGADLLDAQLQGANLLGTDLQSAHLTGAHLHSAHLEGAHLEGANLRSAHLEGTYLLGTHFEGAYLGFAYLRGALSRGAYFQGADMERAQLQGANLEAAKLQGTNLESAHLEGTYLEDAQLRGSVLDSAALYGASNSMKVASDVSFLPAPPRGLKIKIANGSDEKGATPEDLAPQHVYAPHVNWQPLSRALASEIDGVLQSIIPDKKISSITSNRLKKAVSLNASKLHLQSCLAPSKLLNCEKNVDPEKPGEVEHFISQLHIYLGKLACMSPEIARGIIRQIPEKRDAKSTRAGLQLELNKLLNESTCAGLQNLTAEEKNKLRAMR